MVTGGVGAVPSAGAVRRAVGGGCTWRRTGGLGGGLDFLGCAEGTSAQARAVFELPGDLRGRIRAHYDMALTTCCERNAAVGASLFLAATAQPTTGLTNRRSEHSGSLRLQGASVGFPSFLST